MTNMSRMRLTIVVLIILTLVLTACTRSASTPPPETDEELPSGAQSETQATMDAVRSEASIATLSIRRVKTEEAVTVAETGSSSILTLSIF